MYIGFAGKENGKCVQDEDAFSYAMERCTTDCIEEFVKEFEGYFICGMSEQKVLEFREDVVEWFFSGNWIKNDKESETKNGN